LRRVDKHVLTGAQAQDTWRFPAAILRAILVPGMGRAARRAERERNGVPLHATVLAQVEEVAKSLDITPLSARA
jgi:LDH2 family malate/lactate/ureidoglycolate dehydrogenase